MTKKSNHISILVVDDAPDTIELLKRWLSAAGYTVYTSSNVEDGINVLETTPIDLVITDLKMPKVSGLSLVRHVHENYKATEVIMITGYPSIEGAVEAVKTGAEEYLAKPFTEEELIAAVNNALQKLKLKLSRGQTGEPETHSKYGIIGRSKSMRTVFDTIEKAAQISATVLITGESGTGKELVARAIHYHGPRAAASFVPVNCGGIPENLLESELFGHVKGAFTGAHESRAGFFQTADGGTIFLDEISETSMPMQVKLLRVLQDKQICMVGSKRPQKIDVRIVAATNKELWELVDKGHFREDLFYRLNVLTIHVPPLRERGEDVLLLTDYFARKYAQEIGKTQPKFTSKALQVLADYYWPGNVRELENMVQRLVVMHDEPEIDVVDLPSHLRYSAAREKSFRRPLAEVEREYIRNVLDSVKGNKSKAAEILEIDRKTLRKKLKE